MPTEPTLDLITTKEAAAILGVSEVAMQQWRHRGQGPPYYKLIGCYRYDRAEVVGWRKANRTEPQAEVS